MEKFADVKAKEHQTMIKARKITQDLNLEMKIGDVEYQGDGSKAIFYYIADGRVDFRHLIKVLAEVLKVRIEMKQIGARQEAGRIGGIGPCGRELCCAMWQNNFISVSTTAARLQDISSNPLKLAGQCAKIKCCVNYEVPVYTEASADFPNKDTVLRTMDGDYYCIKVDVFKRLMTYSSSPNGGYNVKTISVDRAKEIVGINKSGNKVESLMNEAGGSKQAEFRSATGEDSITRFDAKRRFNNNNMRNNNQNRNNQTRNANNRNNNVKHRNNKENSEENSIQINEFKSEN
jgi:cell fate regulator YaaT (PSP1 superfamily)